MTEPITPDYETLARQAYKLKLIDRWTTRDTFLVLTKGSVTYRVSLPDSASFLHALIRTQSSDKPDVNARAA